MSQWPGSAEDALSTRQKKSMSWLDISVWLNEQRSNIVGSFIDNVYMYSKKLVVLRLKKSGKQINHLIVEPGKRISLTDMQVSLSVLKGVMDIWRRHVRDCRVADISQYDKERVVIFTLRCGNVEKKLIVELLPRGTIVLTNSDMEIIIALENKRMKDRVIAPKQKYQFPPKLWEADIESVDVEKVIKDVIEKRQNVVSYFVKILGLPPEVVEAALYLCGVKSSYDENVDKHMIECLTANVKKLLKDVVERPEPCIAYLQNTPIGFYPFKPSHLAKYSGVEIKFFQSFNEAIDRYFAHGIEELMQRERTGSIINSIEKLKHTLQDMDKRLQEYKDKCAFLSKALKVFEEHYLELEDIHKCVQKVVKQRGWDKLDLCSNLISTFDKSSGKYHVVIENTDLELDVKMNLIDVYNSYRKEFSDVNKDIKRIEGEMMRLKEEIDKKMSMIDVEKKSIEMMLHRSREWYEKFHWAITPRGFLILGGRDSQQNVHLIRKFLEEKDIVLHADIHGGSAVIIKTGGREVDEVSLREAALLAACYSKAWKLGLQVVDVFWVQGSQVSLSPPPGQYLPRGGFMVYGKKNYIHDVILELAVGIEVLKPEIGCTIRIVVGSQDSIAKKCGAYFVIKPGDMKIDEIVERFLSELSKRGLDVVAKALDVNELRAKIPGKSRIAKIVVSEEIKKVLEEC